MFAARMRQEAGDVFALNGDELVAVDFHALIARHREGDAAATIAVARPTSPFGVVEVGDDDVITGFKEGGRIPYWVSCGVYVFSQEVIDRLPDIGDHETTTFPELVEEGRLRAYRHEGLWLTVNTPKELRRAQEHVAEHPDWLGA
jgi:NDP-sugar pyrophosphorylase family protein